MTRARPQRLLLLILALLCGLARPAAAEPSTDYRVGPGDLLKVTVYRAPDLESTLRVADDGTVIMPPLGRLHVADLTASQVADAITRQLKARGVFLDPSVNVLVTEIHSKTASVLGAVTRPGEVVLDRPNITVSEVLARAGAAFTSSAGVVAIVDAKTNAREQISFDALAAGAGDRPVHPGEVLFVQAAPTFYIRGEVTHAGEYPITAGLTVDRAIALGGGLTDRGSAAKVRLERHDAQGKVVELRRVKPDTTIAPGDLLIVGARLF